MVAGETSVRSPLCFLLEAEGYEVLVDDPGQTTPDFDCVVVDDGRFRSTKKASDAFGAFGKPIVVLTDRDDLGDASKGVIAVQKPPLGRAVAEAVAAALALRESGWGVAAT